MKCECRQDTTSDNEKETSNVELAALRRVSNSVVLESNEAVALADSSTVSTDLDPATTQLTSRRLTTRNRLLMQLLAGTDCRTAATSQSDSVMMSAAQSAAAMTESVDATAGGELSEDLNSVNVTELLRAVELLPGTSGLSAGAGSLCMDTNGLSAGTSGLTAGTSGLSAGAGSLCMDTNGLSAGTSGLTDRTSGLTAGTSGLSAGSSGLTGGTGSLTARTSSLSTSISGLTDGAGGLTAGSSSSSADVEDQLLMAQLEQAIMNSELSLEDLDRLLAASSTANTVPLTTSSAGMPSVCTLTDKQLVSQHCPTPFGKSCFFLSLTSYWLISADL